MYGTTAFLLLTSMAVPTLINAHMIMDTPVPFDKANINNSPLDNTGDNFPCKFGNVETGGQYGAIVTTMNHMAVGEPQSLSFIGGATHGGGSCQVSLTTDATPTKNSQWKVIQSIIGGCPSNATGNLSEDSDGTGAAVFSFAIPRGIPNGRYSLAWTWFNKIGNREMYMNCAPITVTGGSSRVKRAASMPDAWNKLPTMFVANIPNEDCSTTEEIDLVFPPPFQSGAPAETPFETATGFSLTGSGCASMTMMGNGNGKAAVVAAPTPAAGGAGSSTSAPSYVASTPSYAASSPSVIATSTPVPAGTGYAASSRTAYSVTPPYPTGAAASTPAASVGTGNSGSLAGSSGSCPSGQVSCSGTLICIGSNQFGLCDNGCAIPQQLAAGTSCSGGSITKRGVRYDAPDQDAWSGYGLW